MKSPAEFECFAHTVARDADFLWLDAQYEFAAAFTEGTAPTYEVGRHESRDGQPHMFTPSHGLTLALLAEWMEDQAGRTVGPCPASVLGWLARRAVTTEALVRDSEIVAGAVAARAPSWLVAGSDVSEPECDDFDVSILAWHGRDTDNATTLEFTPHLGWRVGIERDGEWLDDEMGQHIFDHWVDAVNDYNEQINKEEN